MKFSRYEKVTVPPVKPFIFKKGASNKYPCPFSVGKENKPHPREFHASARDHHMLEHHYDHLQQFWNDRELGKIVFWTKYCSSDLQNVILMQLDKCLTGHPVIVPHTTEFRKTLTSQYASELFPAVYDGVLNDPLIPLPTESVCVFCLEEDQHPTVQFCRKNPSHALHPACALMQLDIWLAEVGIYQLWYNKDGSALYKTTFNMKHEKLNSPSQLLPPRCACMTCREPIADTWKTLAKFRLAIWVEYHEQLSNYDTSAPYQAIEEKRVLTDIQLNESLLQARQQELADLLQELSEDPHVNVVDSSSDSDYIPTPGIDNHADDYHDDSSGSSVSDSLL